MKRPGDALAHGITLLLDGAATDAQRSEVYDTVRRDPQARAIYIEQMLLHAGLLFNAEGMAASAPHRRIGRIPGRVWRTAAAAVIVLGFAVAMSLLFRLSQPRAAHTAQSVATLIDATAAEWGRGDLPTAVGSQLRGGFLRLRSGSATLEFYSGARVTLTGPCEFGLNAPMRGFLKSGKLAAYVPPQAHGFTVAAPGCAVIDQGTEFRMDVAEGATDVLVLKGRVQIEKNHQVLSLAAGQAARDDGRSIQQIAVAKTSLREPTEFPVNLLTNGGFEQGLGGWQTLHRVNLDQRPRRVSHGSAALQFNAGESPVEAQISQVIATTPGMAYRITFDLGKAGSPSGSAAMLVEAFDGDAAAGRLLFKRIASQPPGINPGRATRYTAHAFTFTAASPRTTIRFTDASTEGGRSFDTYLDEVRVVPLDPGAAPADVPPADEK